MWSQMHLQMSSINPLLHYSINRFYDLKHITTGHYTSLPCSTTPLMRTIYHIDKDMMLSIIPSLHLSINEVFGSIHITRWCQPSIHYSINNLYSFRYIVVGCIPSFHYSITPLMQSVAPDL